MKLTPLDIKQQQFSPSFRGVDKKEVETFLEDVAGEIETLIHECNDLKEKIAYLNRDLEEHRQREKTLRETLVTAQKMTDEMRDLAEREAQNLIGKAEIQAERLLNETERRREKVVEDIQELKRYKVRFESTLRNQIEVHLNMLEALREEEQKPIDAEDNLAFLKRKRIEAEEKLMKASSASEEDVT